MIDTDKYEELTIDDWYKMNHHDWKDVVNEHNDLLAEVKRLREELEEAEQEKDKYSGVLNLAIPYIGHTGMSIEYENYLKDDYGITVYGDEYVSCDCEGCSGYVKDKYDCYIIKSRGNQESAKCDNEDCPYSYGEEDE